MITTYLQYLYLVVLTICSLFAFYQWQKNGLKKYLVFSIYLIIVLITEFATLIYKGMTKSNPSFIYNYALPFHGIAIAFLYDNELQKKWNRRIQLIASSVFFIIAFSYLAFSNTYIFIDNNGLLISGFYILCSLHYYFYQINYPDEIAITKKMLFWISTSLITWSIIFIFRMMLKDYLYQLDNSFLTLLQIILSSFNIIIYLVFIKGLSCRH